LRNLLVVSALLFAFLFSYFVLTKGNAVADYRLVTNTNSTGFIPADCWFTPDHDWPPVECFQMQVPEDHARPEGRYITFPVIVFRSETASKQGSPLLHLGAGGPGAPMYLDYSYAVNELWRLHDDMSINMGRDLFIIDPRGTGLSRPLLSCGEFVDNELLRFELNLSMEENIRLNDKDYFKCIDEFLAEGIDLSNYNSFSIAKDVEAMRIAANVEQWVLLGVSYGSTYAQTIAELFPESIAAMVLDSATFPRVKAHHDFVRRTITPYRKLFNYCDSDPVCTEPDRNMEKRIWALVEKLSEKPVFMLLDNPYSDSVIPFNLNGDRLIGALFEGIYGVEIFSELPAIVSDLESRRQESIKPYVLSYVEYMLDRTWGDVSATAHYCFEDKPFIDFQQINELIEELPEGYIRTSARYYESWSKYCDRMEIDTVAPVLVPSEPFPMPTLFLQGRFDGVTPLSDVEANRSYFTNNRLLTFDRSHSILTADDCAEELAAKFLEKLNLEASDITCDDSIKVN